MPLTWTIDHEARTIMATASGVIDNQEIFDYLAALVGQGAVGYRAIFDARRAAGVNVRTEDIAAQGKLVASRKSDGFDGAIALITSSDAESEMAKYFAAFLSGARLCRIFRTVEDARAWYAELDAQARR